MPWFPTKGSIRRHMISQSEGSQRSSQLAKYNPMYSFPSNSAAPAASVRVSVSAWQSHATINQICGRKRRKWCGLTAASQWRKPNYTARRRPPSPHPPSSSCSLAHSFSLSALSSHSACPLTSSFLRFSMQCHYTSPQIEDLCWLQSHTCCICSA